MTTTPSDPRLRASVGAAAVAAACLAAAGEMETVEAPYEADDAETLENMLRHVELVVTAEKIEEDILAVPMTITAFDADMLEQLVLQDRIDLQTLVPGLQFGDEMDQEGQGTVIRGIGTRLAGQTHTDRAVATYVDGAYTIGLYGTLPGGGFDLARIEVARGPQGTLNGRNSIAGSVNLVYKKPTPEWDAEVMTEFTDVAQQRVNVAVGGPLGGALSFRLTGGAHTGDGWQENIGRGGDYDRPDHAFFAPQVRFATERFDMNVRVSRVEDKGASRSLVTLNNLNTTDPFVTLGPQGSQRAPAPPGAEPVANELYRYATRNPAVDADCPVGVPGFRCGDIRNKVALNFAGRQESEADQVNLYAEYQLTETLSVRYSFHENDVSMVNVKDGDYANRVAIAGDHTLASDGMVTPFEDTHYVLPYIYDEASHEVQITSDFPGPFNFIAGLFAYENTTFWDLVRVDQTRPWRFGTADEQARAASPIFGFVPVDSCMDVLTGVIEPFGIGTSDPAQADDFEGLYWYCPPGDEHTATVRFYTGAESSTRAAFVTGTLAFSDRWTVSGGLRHTADEKSQKPEDGGGFALLEVGSLLGVFFPNGGVSDAHTWDRTIGHVSLEYTTVAENLIYGRVSTGYRSGGFNSPIPGLEVPFIEEETLVNYELGAKGIYLDSRLRLTVGLWRAEYDGFQLNGNQPPPEGLRLPVWSDTPLAEYTSNIDDTTLWGADVEFSYLLSERWRLTGFYAFQGSEIGPHSSVIWADPYAEYGQWEHVDFDTGEPTTSSYPLATDMTGNELPMQPRHKLALTLAHERSLADGSRLVLRTIYGFTGRQHPNIGNVPDYEMPSYGRWDANAAWTSAGGTWSVLLFAQNIRDEIGLVEFVPVSGIGGNPALGYPTNHREIGLQVRYRPFDRRVGP